LQFVRNRLLDDDDTVAAADDDGQISDTDFWKPVTCVLINRLSTLDYLIKLWQFLVKNITGVLCKEKFWRPSHWTHPEHLNVVQIVKRTSSKAQAFLSHQNYRQI
jgi:hypothetical protein